jgi:glycosyltransferase involved in cell wall biosynthesis
MSHWIFNNYAAYSRCLSLQKRKGVSLSNRKLQEINYAIEYADFATVLGNNFTISTYGYAQKPIFPLCVPAVTVYPWPDNKNYDAQRNNYLWLGSSGLVHKGLDLAIDAFVEMRDKHLYICGPVKQEKNFQRAYYEQLYQTPNIHTIGWIDVTSSEFIKIANKCIGLIYPSCAEGQSGAVVTCLHAGLIPIVSYESGVDVNDFGVILEICSIDEIVNAINKISRLPIEELRLMSRKAWEYARAHHTLEKYAERYRKVIEQIQNNYI